MSGSRKKYIRLLLVEDSEADADLLLRDLSRGGFEPFSERVDTRDGLRRSLEGGPWDLILCDNSMPGFSGAEALAVSKSLRPGIPFAFLSGTKRVSGPAAGDPGGAIAHLDKGETRELLALIDRVLSGAPMAAGSTSDAAPGTLRPADPAPRPRILIVDDQPENILALETALEGLEVDLVGAGSGQEALAKLLDRDFALILLDVRMPGMGGLETAELIRKRERTRSVPVIFMTAAMDSPAEAARGYATGCVDYLSKPVVTEVLRAKVGVFLELWRKTMLLERQAAELRTANEGLEAFAGSAAHDLRAPLRAIMGFSGILSDEYAGKVLDAEAQECLAKIQKAAVRMDALIRDLLVYSHLSLRDVPSAPSDLTKLIDEVLAGLSAEILSSGATVRVERPLGAVLAHGVSLRQAVENLVTNALKFTAPGKPPAVRIRSEPRPRGRRRLWVEDEGIGIRKGEQVRLFQPFSRLEGASGYAGTGLGLATVKRAVEKMGGSVGLESEFGKGSRFYIELPESLAPGTPARPSGDPGSSPAG